VERITQRIAEHGGWLSFADYMQMALYEPGLGYYVAGARKFGAAGDFVTAPEMTSLFGQSLANQVAEALAEVGGSVLELGAGSGRLAVDLLAELERLGHLPERYSILEVSADLRARQRALIETELPAMLDRVVWLDALPEYFTGVVVGNEVLDALPVHLVHWRDGDLFERGVTIAPETGFAWQERSLAQSALARAAEALPIEPADYLSEVNLAAGALVQSLAERIERGLLLFLDYGFPRHEYYHPDRSQGTLMCHYRHHAFDAPFFLPGLIDITAHVDFTAVADAAIDAGLDVLGYVDQARFLVNCGVLSALERYEPGTAAYLKQAAAVGRLLQPSEMGELFKVIALGKDYAKTPLGLAAGDRRHTL
jgi:SAM-dependent MidA family methyltransferase